MRGCRFTAVELRYGCHEGRWALPDEDRPVMITGPNGSGKTTLVEGLVRTVFGFDRRRAADAGRFDARRPWDRDEMRGTVRISREDEILDIRRDFLTDRVRVESPTDGVRHFEGDGNSGARNREARQYRQIIAEILGLGDLEGYTRTLFIRQGALPASRLGEHLLRVAAGGHARVESARRDIAEAHRAITRRAIGARAGPAVNPRELEKVDEEIATLRSRLAEAREAGERRGPLALERERVAERLQALDREIETLEDAQSALARSEAVDLNARQLRERVRILESAARELHRAREEVEAAEARVRQTTGAGIYPEDFPQRLARVEVRWQDLHTLSRGAARWTAVATLVLVAAGALLFLTGYTVPAIVAGSLALLSFVAWGTLRFGTGRRRRVLRRQIATTLRDVPAADTLRPATVDRHLEAFRAQHAAADRLGDARAWLAGALRDARAVLRAPSRDEASSTAEATEHGRAARVAARLTAAAESARDHLDAALLELERVGDLSLRLPAGVAPTESGVAEALRERRAERLRVLENLQRIGQELLERGSPSESVGALEASLASLLPRREALARKAEVLEAAYALVTDAYNEFRDRDQERLVRFVSGHIERLTDGALGPVLAEEVLEEARLGLDGRVVPLESPPLSFGEYHAALLGVRLGAADFLAGIGVAPPLIIDEPFAHLDHDHAHALWDLLRVVARDRQVIVTTQDELLVRHLGIDPDIRLED